LITVQDKKGQLFERVRKLILEHKLFVDSPVFERLEKYGIYNYSDFESFYQEVPLKELEDFVDSLGIVEEVEDEELPEI